MEFEQAEWSPKILVGLPNIDAQHRQLFDLAATFVQIAGDKVPASMNSSSPPNGTPWAIRDTLSPC